MADRRPLVIVGGVARQLPADDSIAGVRELLTAARDYFVRADGSDSYSGMLDSATGAFRTIQKAIDTVATLDLGIFDVTIYVQAGTWTPTNNILKNVVGAGVVNIRGRLSGTSTMISCAGNCFQGEFLGTYVFSNLKFQSTTGSAMAIGPGGGKVKFSSVDFGACVAHITCNQGSFAQATGPYSISAGGSIHCAVYDGGHARIQNTTVTLTGTPGFSVSFFNAERGGVILANGMTWSGSATGKRFNASTGGGVFTGGASGALPGNSTGTTTSPGWSS